MNVGRSLVLLVLCTIALVACGSPQPTGSQVASFSFTDQNGNPFGTDQLNGKVWIADFIFTDCKTVCPPMTAEMAQLQKHFTKEGVEVEFVSFTVDPTIDSSEVLKEYIAQYTDDESNWHLLTGYSQEAIKNLALEQFQTIVQKPENSSQVIHGTNFYLIDQKGYIVNEFNYVEDTFTEQMQKEVKKLLK
ncbi:SCO family protein [Sporosarcina sp. Sa2YVA2]|uniref:SCO family protein n=1 Tax=Sporosarcina quadrami TaxID=2762234 RepID=A0ABR8U8W4_9BACL|nr:SCO family protein [Sporosarcina quadrami]MBD7984471.1 SCO family protein [Sporosarcina quadrami]